MTPLPTLRRGLFKKVVLLPIYRNENGKRGAIVEIREMKVDREWWFKVQNWLRLKVKFNGR